MNYTEPINHSFIIHKKGWGYIEAEVYTDQKWIQIEKKKLFVEDFIDDQIEVRYKVIPEYIEEKVNGAYIKIVAGEQQLRHEVIVKKLPLIRLSLSKLGFYPEDKGHLIIENFTGEDLKLKVAPGEKWIQFEARKYLIGKKAEIPFEVKLTRWIRLANKKPFYETTIQVKSKSRKYTFTKDIEIHVGDL
jgi:hypothetical protein